MVIWFHHGFQGDTFRVVPSSVLLLRCKTPRFLGISILSFRLQITPVDEVFSKRTTKGFDMFRSFRPIPKALVFLSDFFFAETFPPSEGLSFKRRPRRAFFGGTRLKVGHWKAFNIILKCFKKHEKTTEQPHCHHHKSTKTKTSKNQKHYESKTTLTQQKTEKLEISFRSHLQKNGAPYPEVAFGKTEKKHPLGAKTHPVRSVGLSLLPKTNGRFCLVGTKPVSAQVSG